MTPQTPEKSPATGLDAFSGAEVAQSANQAVSGEKTGVMHIMQNKGDDAE